MKKILFLLLLIFSFLSFPVYSEDIEYSVKFKEWFDIPFTLRDDLNVIREEKRLYTTKNCGILDEYKDYIENFYKIEEIEMLSSEDIEIFSAPSDPEYKNQTHHTLINTQKSFDIETYGNDIRVGIIDSGCFEHSDLKDNLLPGWNYIDANDNTTDTNGHGTHVSGLIAASINGSGVVGVAPKAKIIPFKCFDNNSGNPLHIIAAIYNAVDIFKCDIINMSLGIKESNYLNQSWRRDFEEAIEYANKKGVIMVAAAGNYNGNDLCYPAALDGVIGVGSVDYDKEKSSFSQYNSSVMAVAPAPAGLVLSTYIKKSGTKYIESYGKSGGTSQAAPQVAGMAAIALSVNPALTSKDFEELLKVTSEDLGDVGRDDYYGYGLINIKNMIEKQQENINIYVSPVNINKGKAEVYIKNNSLDELNGESIFADYEGSKFLSHIKEPVDLKAGEDNKYYFDFSGNKVSYFLWKSFSDILPYSKERRVNVKE